MRVKSCYHSKNTSSCITKTFSNLAKTVSLVSNIKKKVVK